MPALRTHKCDCLKQQQSVPRALGFPSELRGFWVKSLHTQPSFMRSHMQACWPSVWCRTRSASYEGVYIINFCFLRLLLLILLPVLLLNLQPRSLQQPPPPPKSLFWQLFLMLTKPPVDRILLLHCGFLSPAITSPQPHHPLLFFSFFCLWLIIISKLGFVLYDDELTGS